LKICKNVALLLFAIAPALVAQRTEGRVTLGVTSFADEGAVNHFTAGGSARLYLSRRWSIEPEFLHMRHNNFVRDRDYLLWGNISFDFRDRERQVVPYWFAAPGLVHHRSTFANQTFSTTEAAVASGAGVRLFVSDRIFVAPQFRFGLADGVFAEVTGSIGFVLRK
jgi:hypothetical protein